jgi:hypothetical protein
LINIESLLIVKKAEVLKKQIFKRDEVRFGSLIFVL